MKPKKKKNTMLLFDGIRIEDKQYKKEQQKRERNEERTGIDKSLIFLASRFVPYGHRESKGTMKRRE